jgi:hypothetical protein
MEAEGVVRAEAEAEAEGVAKAEVGGVAEAEGGVDNRGNPAGRSATLPTGGAASVAVALDPAAADPVAPWSSFGSEPDLLGPWSPLVPDPP